MIYKSKYLNHSIVVSAERKIMENGNLIIIPGKKIEFKNGTYETNDKKEIEFLRSLKTFNVDIFEIDPKEIKKQKEINEYSTEVAKLLQNKELDIKDLKNLVEKKRKKTGVSDIPTPTQTVTQTKGVGSRAGND